MALLILFKIGYDFYKHYYYTEDVPRISEVVRMARDAHHNWDLERVRKVIGGESFKSKLAPRIRVAAFVAMVWIVILLAGGFLVYEYALYFAAGGKPRKRSWFAIWLRRVIVGGAGLGVLCLLYGFFIEPYWLEVTHIEVATPKLARGSQPIRIVLLSDLHMARKVCLEPRLPDLVAAQHPDIIVFTGDAMNTSWALGRFKQFLLNMNEIAPVFLVRGNQDDDPFWQEKNIYFGTRAHELIDQKPEAVTIRGTELWFEGRRFANGYTADDTPPIPPPNPNDITVFLSHSSEYLRSTSRAQARISISAGHTHGGQVALPFYGALITYARFDKQYERGRATKWVRPRCT